MERGRMKDWWEGREEGMKERIQMETVENIGKEEKKVIKGRKIKGSKRKEVRRKKKKEEVFQKAKRKIPACV